MKKMDYKLLGPKGFDDNDSVEGCDILTVRLKISGIGGK